MNSVLQSDDDVEENEPTSEEEALQMAERLNDRRVLLASFLKLAMFSVIDNKMVAPIWALYIRVSALYNIIDKSALFVDNLFTSNLSRKVCIL